MHLRIRRGIDKQGGLPAKLFEKAVELGQKRYLDPDSLTLWERLQNLAVDFLVRRKVRRRFGGRIKALVSGGAALNYDIGLFFTALRLPLDRQSTRLNSRHLSASRMPSSACTKKIEQAKD